jgi:hypothetical protein
MDAAKQKEFPKSGTVLGSSSSIRKTERQEQEEIPMPETLIHLEPHQNGATICVVTHDQRSAARRRLRAPV